MKGRITTAIVTGLLVVALAVVVATAAGATTEAATGRSTESNLEPPHRVRPIAATQQPTVAVDAGLQAKAVTVAALQHDRALAVFFAMVQRDQQEDAARAVAARSRSTGSPGGGGGGVLDCIRHRESRGNYGVVNGSSGAAGAYQFMPSTWNNTARSAGRSDLVGVSPSAASPADQDAMAKHLLATQGLGPWGGGCR